MSLEQNDPLSNASARPPLYQHYREPRPFSAKPGEDFDEWLTHYERVSQCNNWNPASQLRHVVFYLTDTALVWYENHADTLTTWSSLIEEMKKCFSDSDTKKKRAETALAQRAQVIGETCTTYIEEVLKLCKTIDSRMPEEDKVGHLLKGIAEDVYNFLIGKDNLNTVSDVIRHCRTFEALKTRRITPKFGRLANVTTVASVDASPQTDLSATIRQIVREELLRHEEQTRYAVPRCASVAFRDAVCASPPATWQHSVNAADCNSYRHDPHYGQTEQRHYDSIDRRFDQHPRDVRPRRPSTAYDIQGEGMSYSQPVAAVEYFNQRPEVRPLPVCYNCGTPGHIARYCNRRRAFSNGQSGSFMQHGGRAMDTNRPGNTTFEGYFREERSRHFPLDSYSGEQERYRNRYRSPASERTLTPPPAFRASRSPSPRRRVTSSSPRRRFASPPPGN